MRKVFVVSLLLGLCVSSAFGFASGSFPTGVGAKYAGMGGAGSAIVDDITSAYFNPAGIIKTGNMELKIGAGAATEGLNDIIGALGNASNPAKFMADNYNKTISIKGGLNAIVGINIAKIGLSVIPAASLTLTKPTPGTFLGTTAFAGAAYEGILTMGYSLSVPGLPIASLDLGANVKSANYVFAMSGATGATTTTDEVSTISGIGFDLGAKANIDNPVIPVSVGIVIKDIAESLKGKTKSQNSVYDPATGNVTTTTLGEGDAAETTMPTTTVIGASTVIPGVGLRVAIDYDSVAGGKVLGVTQNSYNVTHIGVEYPILGIIALRAGTVSGGPSGAEISQTTIGAGFSLGANINVAMMTDAKNSKNNSTMVDFGFAF